jgi:hypothetical protein
MACIHDCRSGTHVDGHTQRFGDFFVCSASIKRRLDVKCDAVVATHGDAYAKRDELIKAAAEPSPGPEDPAFGVMFDRFANARVVLLGEASHGTSEFYRARARITCRLIERHGFNIVAVEADWPDAERIDRYVRHKDVHVGSGPAFRRFPQWMWRNVDAGTQASGVSCLISGRVSETNCVPSLCPQGCKERSA